MKGGRKQAAVTIKGFVPTVHVEAEVMLQAAATLQAAAVIRPANTRSVTDAALAAREKAIDLAGAVSRVMEGVSESIAGEARLGSVAEQSVRLRFCETIVAITAPKGRIDEFLGDHRTELLNLVREFGVARGTWICRLRLAGTTLHMLPAIAVRIWALWKIS